MRQTHSRFCMAALLLVAVAATAAGQQRAFYSSRSGIRVTKDATPPTPAPSVITRVSVKGNYTVVTIPDCL